MATLNDTAISTTLTGVTGPVPPFLWERDVLVEQYGSRRYLYGRWDRRFGCWLADPHEAGARSFYPSWPLVDASGRLCLGRCTKPILWDDAEEDYDEWFDYSVTYTDPVELSTWCHGHYSTDDMPVSEFADTAECFFRRYVDLIPFATRRIAGGFGTWQWVILSMIWEEPAFAGFLRTELDGSGPGFVAASLLMNSADKLTSVERSDLCRRIMFGKREQLIPGIPATCSPKAVVTAFRKLQLDSLSVCTCRELLGILSDPRKAKVVAHGCALTSGMIRLLDRLPDWMCTGIPPRLFWELDDDEFPGEALVTLARLVDRQPTDLANAIKRSLCQARDCDHLVSVIEAWNARISEVTHFPAPPFPSIGLLKPLSSGGMIRSEAHRMRNCIADYLPDVMKGLYYFYRWDAAEPACIMLMRGTRGNWRLGECLGANNGKLTEPTQARITAVVRAALRGARVTGRSRVPERRQGKFDF